MAAAWRGNKGVAIKRIHRRDAEIAEVKKEPQIDTDKH